MKVNFLGLWTSVLCNSLGHKENKMDMIGGKFLLLNSLCTLQKGHKG